MTIEKLQEIKRQLNDAFPERSRLINGTLTAILAGEHVLMLGPPGTAKSAFARAIAETMADGSFFEIMLTKHTTPEEIYGPVSFKAFKDDRYQRALDGYAATKKVWFFDEIFKGSSAILNANLTAMNERIYHNGGKPTKIPLEVMLAASNEYPQDDSLNAFFDRFMLKFWVDYISDRDSMKKLLVQGGVKQITCALSGTEVDALRTVAEQMPMDDTMTELCLDIKAQLEAEGFIASTRSWVKAVKIVKAQAVVNGRTKLNSEDFNVLSDVFWKQHKDRDAISAVIGRTADPYGAKALAIIDSIRAAMVELPDMTLLRSGQKNKVAMVKEIGNVHGNVMSRMDALRDLMEQAGDNSTVKEADIQAQESLRRITELMNDVTLYRAARV